MNKFSVNVGRWVNDGDKKKKESYGAEVYALNLNTKPPKFLAYSESFGFHLVDVSDCKPVKKEIPGLKK